MFARQNQIYVTLMGAIDAANPDIVELMQEIMYKEIICLRLYQT